MNNKAYNLNSVTINYLKKWISSLLNLCSAFAFTQLIILLSQLFSQLQNWHPFLQYWSIDMSTPMRSVCR